MNVGDGCGELGWAERSTVGFDLVAFSLEDIDGRSVNIFQQQYFDTVFGE